MMASLEFSPTVENFKGTLPEDHVGQILFDGKSEEVPVKNPPSEPWPEALRSTPNRYHRVLYNSQCSHGVNTGVDNPWFDKRGRVYPKNKKDIFCGGHEESYRVRRFYHNEHAQRNNVLNFSPGPAYAFFPHIQCGTYHRNSTGTRFGGAKRTTPRQGKSSRFFEPGMTRRPGVTEWHDKRDEEMWMVDKLPKWQDEVNEKLQATYEKMRHNRKGMSRSWTAVIEAEKAGLATERGTRGTRGRRGGSVYNPDGTIREEGSTASLRQGSFVSSRAGSSVIGEKSSIFLPPLSTSGSGTVGSPRGSPGRSMPPKRFVAREPPPKPKTFPYANAHEIDIAQEVVSEINSNK